MSEDPLHRTPPRGMPFSINRIGHVVLSVSDLARLAEFYSQVLGLKVSDVYSDSMMTGSMVFLRFNTDHHGIALVSAATAPSTCAELHHVAFQVSRLDEVIRARDHLRRHNAEINLEGRCRAGVQIAVEFRDPDAHHLEIYWGLDQVGSDGSIRPATEWSGAQSLADAIANPIPGQGASLRDPTLKA